MKWLRNVFRSGQEEAQASLRALHEKFSDFLTLLETNNHVLKIISDMEEKSQGEYLFDINYIRSSLAEVRIGVREIIDKMIALGGEPYEALREQYAAIDAEIEKALPGNRRIERDDFTIPFDKLGRERASSVGSKNAQLGEMRKLGLPTPDGFAISAWAYKYFVDANSLQARISKRIESLDIKHYSDLMRVSEEIRALVVSSPVPDELAEAIQKSYSELFKGTSSRRFSLRSSAIGEDTLFSFAGQYATFLNVGEDELIARYREVLASKFTPQAIYYFLSHSLTESELAMSVGCVEMVDAASSGVVYTRDPVKPENGCVLINSIFGLGKYLVDGTLSPDVFCVSRDDKTLRESRLAKKTVRLTAPAQGGTVEECVPDSMQQTASLTEEQATLLADFALRLEKHYGGPQDIEWAIDHEGKLFLLQTRPLRIVSPRTTAAPPDVSGFRLLMAGGTVVCPGAGSGPVFHVASTQDLAKVPDGAVLVAPHPFPGLITAIGRANALVARTGSVASHMATIAREYCIPTLVGLEDAGALPAGESVTVDATGAAIYAGAHPELAMARRPECELFDDTAIIGLLNKTLIHISPLNLVHPGDSDFIPQSCRTFHDITRFAHQKAMEEMFSTGKDVKHKERFSLRLKSDIPLQLNIIYVDQDFSQYGGKSQIGENEIESIPMKAFWDGFRKEKWPVRPPSGDFKGFVTVMTSGMTAQGQPEFSENSFAVLSKEYMILSLRMGFHFTTIEAMCTQEPSKNYIRMKYKDGGASIDRRVRRIKLIVDVLSKMGFENSSKGDFLDAMISYIGADTVCEKLRLLGRINMMTKQLDMALSNDAIAEWYTRDYIKKLGLQDAKDGGS